jgi:Kef-type K+ transport system membrane component KefB
MLASNIPIFLMAGIALALALLIGKATHWIKVTGVVGYLLTGFLLGPEVLQLVKFTRLEIEMITWFSLGFIGFTLGGKLPLQLLRKSGKKIIFMMLGGIVFPFVFVLGGIYFLKGNLSLGLIFGALACTSAPAGTIAVIYEYRARGKLTNAIVAVVGLDDAFGVVVFAVTIAGVSAIMGGSNSFLSAETLWEPAKEIGGALLLGGAAGGILALIVKKVHERAELFVLTLAILLSSIGTAMWLGFSVILASITMGMVFVNILPHECRIVFRDMDRITLPIFILFFLTAGLELRLDLLLGSGALVLVYVLFRTIGKLSGPMAAAGIARTDPKLKKYLGFGILPQAGVALGLALLASHKLVELGKPELAGLVITTITATTVVFEIIGPIGTRFALVSSGEARRK